MAASNQVIRANERSRRPRSAGTPISAMLANTVSTTLIGRCG